MLPLTIISGKIVGETIIGDMVKQTSHDVYNLLGHLRANYGHLEEKLEELDLDNMIRIWLVFLQENIKNVKDKALILCIESLHEIIGKIREELRVLNRNVEEHKKKWFNYWRDDGSDEVIRKLVLHKKVFLERVNLFYHIYGAIEI